MISTMTERDLALMIACLKQFPLKITGTTGWKEAQVTAGGIRCDELDPQTLESRRCKGLYITGELLDVDGDCGGFNLQFAWASGYCAGLNAAKSLKEEKRDGGWDQT
jgi:predicted flavoprotein YhiN